MASVLHEIGKATEKRIEQAKREQPLADLKREAEERGYQPKDFAGAFAGDGFHIIAEYKRASPSQGDIAPKLDVMDVVGAYRDAGARAFSILTEPSYFNGDLKFIRRVREQYPDAIILMKDFFVDEYQLYQALHAGADVVLLIVGLLAEEELLALYHKARELKLNVLVEVHNKRELEIALKLPDAVLGINNRDLTDLSINLNTTETLMESVGEDRLVISESGINTTADLVRLAKTGVKGYLVGTSLMKTQDPGPALAKLLGKTHED